jgi:hypothetical protein
MYDRAVMLSVLGFLPSDELAETLVRGVFGDIAGVLPASERTFFEGGTSVWRLPDGADTVRRGAGVWSDEGGAVRVVARVVPAAISVDGEMCQSIASKACESAAEVCAAEVEVDARVASGRATTRGPVLDKSPCPTAG